MDTQILTEDEMRSFKSMSRYWQEVRQRDDQSPLFYEVTVVRTRLGVRILDLVEAYIEMVEEEKALDEVRVCTQEGCPRFGQPLTNGVCI